MIEQMDDLDAIGADYFIAKGPMDKLAVQLNEFITELENRPALPPAEKKILQTGGVFPRRDAMELLGSLEFHQAVVDCLGVGVVVIDKDTRIINANAAALEILRPVPGRDPQPPDSGRLPAEPVRGADRGARKRTSREPTSATAPSSSSSSGRMLRAVVSPLRLKTPAVRLGGRARGRRG
ncbi:MAG: PAS domain-containing protein [Desulfosudis oleivorans]|nr:PAS domain-containing protein [Desulfosudis oleivorans]